MFQGRITPALEPVERQLRGRGPRMNFGSSDKPVHCIREEKVRGSLITVARCIPLGGEQCIFVVSKGGDELIVGFVP